MLWRKLTPNVREVDRQGRYLDRMLRVEKLNRHLIWVDFRHVVKVMDMLMSRAGSLGGGSRSCPLAVRFPPGPYSFMWGRGSESILMCSASSSDWVSPWGENPSPTPLTKRILPVEQSLQVGY
jgi:hypothetical protein